MFKVISQINIKQNLILQFYILHIMVLTAAMPPLHLITLLIMDMITIKVLLREVVVFIVSHMKFTYTIKVNYIVRMY
jgi:hypothetical protein